MRIAPELEPLLRAEERRDAAAEAHYRRDMGWLREVGLKEPEPELDRLDRFRARMAAEAKAEAVAEERTNRIAREHPAPALDDELRAFYGAQQALDGGYVAAAETRPRAYSASRRPRGVPCKAVERRLHTLR
jgi:hypothetical protein